MIKILKKYKKLLIMISFAYIYVVLVLIAPSGFNAITPGFISNTKNDYEISDLSFTNDINTVAVYSWHEISIFQKWLISNIDKYNVRKQTDYESTLTRDEIAKQGRISHESSHNNAIINAYKYAKRDNKTNKTIDIEYELVGLTVYAETSNDLKIGDTIIKINNISPTNKSYEDFLEEVNLFNKNNESTVTADKDYQVTILRDGKESLVTLKTKERFIYYPEYKIIKTTPNILINQNSNVGGPSGGMIQTLSIYSTLLDLKFDNFKISGTGTIETNNRASVGQIGGLKQKIYTVLKAKADYFIIPSSQYNEIEEIALKNADKIKVIKVATFDDVINNFINEVIK